MKALVIDDEYGVRLALLHFLRGRGYEAQAAASGSDGIALAKASVPDIVFLDQRLPDIEGEEILKVLTAQAIGASVIMMTAYVELDKAVQAMKNGADYYFPKPLDLDHVTVILDKLEGKLRLVKELDHYRRICEMRGPDDVILGESPHIVKLQRLISLLAQNITTPVLILGESGCGKELAAKAIHTLSGAKGPLVEINCASLTESLIESELFGHEKGAFTDAKEVKKGLFEIADEGTIFFDELGEMPLPIQAKLLKVLDSKKFRRVGGVTDITSNARFMGATNRDIVSLVKQGLFREDLFYRINVLPITIPPLRERGKDILILAGHFAGKIGEGMGKSNVTIAPEAAEYLLAYDWPGNVRELKNVIERALILSGSGDILPDYLPLDARRDSPRFADNSLFAGLHPLRKIEEDYISHVLEVAGNNHSRAASILGISRSTLLSKIKLIN
jgi:two-component system, NtrC family, response regulator AtoC